MDSQTSWDTDEKRDIREVYRLDPPIPSNTKQNKHTIIKYTKIPDYDQPLYPWREKSRARTRSYVTIDEEPNIKMIHSFRPDLLPRVPNYTKRKVVTLDDNADENGLDKKSAVQPERVTGIQTNYLLNRAIVTDKVKAEKVQYATSNSRDSAKSKGTRRDANPKLNPKREYISGYRVPKTETKVFHMTKKSPARTRASYNSVLTKPIYRKPSLKEIESNQELVIIDSPSPGSYPKENSLKHIHNKLLGLKQNQNCDVIYVPIEPSEHKEIIKPAPENCFPLKDLEESIVTEKSVLLEQIYDSAKSNLIDVQIETNPKDTDDKNTSTDLDNSTFDSCPVTVVNSEKQNGEMQVNIKRESIDFGSLCIPNVSLIDECEELEIDANKFHSLSLPSMYITNTKKRYKESKEKSECHKTPSFIISRATLTYTTKQKIDFHVVTNNERINVPPKIVASYPLNVISLFKENKNKEVKSSSFISRKDYTARDINQNIETKKHVDASTSLELMMPSKAISLIGIDRDFLHTDYVCDQFQKELNFIDSFYESLQYLQNSSLTDKILKKSLSLSDDKLSLTKLNEITENDYCEHALAKLDSNIAQTSAEDVEKIASKNLCLLNMLIRNEQRRAKNLLFVLKLREDALKDFTKSQILWLESKKKCENTDISTLKKKQRGALLKLQHECGEMQRIRKALLTLSDKRKSVLLKTRQNIEFKLNKTNIENGLLNEKKRSKKNFSPERALPLKCFDLSSSGCDESSTSRTYSEAAVVVSVSNKMTETLTPSDENCMQTINKQTPALVEKISTAIAENFVSVDGSYLNIIFHNLDLPNIFSCGKAYEVNKEALINIVHLANSLKTSVALESSVVMNAINQLKSSDKSKSSSPSTARSLVEEFDQYYKGLQDQDYKETSLDKEVSAVGAPKVSTPQEVKCIVKDTLVHSIMDEFKEDVFRGYNGDGEVNNLVKEDYSSEEINVVEDHDRVNKNESHLILIEESAAAAPVIVESSQIEIVSELEVGNKIDTDASDAITSEIISHADLQLQPEHPQISTLSEYGAGPSGGVKGPLPPHPLAAAKEAEELLRKQIAIEQEIKALEQQQSQLLVVREIPDKPPPPYTPPADSRNKVQQPKSFKPDHNLQQIVVEHFDLHYNNESPLQPVDLHYNNVSPLQPVDLYYNIESPLQSVDLHYNIESQIQPIDLHYNNVSPLQPVDLHYNNVSQLQPVDLHYNNASQLQPVDLHYNNVSQLQPVDLHYNNVSQLQPVDLHCNNVSQLQPVDLHYNNVSQLQPVDLHYNNVSSLQPVDLHYNNVSSLQPVDVHYNNVSPLQPVNVDDADPFKGLIKNYCDEVIDRSKVEKSDEPWHPYNLLPKRQEATPEEMKKKVVTDLEQVLSGPPPAVHLPASRRATDHIDDILFAAWPRCEAEWTNLQADEVLVKNQVFESIFQQLIGETINEYKATFTSNDSKDE